MFPSIPTKQLYVFLFALVLAALACTHVFFIDNEADCAEVGGTWSGSACYTSAEEKLIDGRTFEDPMEDDVGDENVAPQDGEASDPAVNSIQIVSVETSSPDGACSPHREDEDFICRYEVAWIVEYTIATPRTMPVCDVILNGERDLLSGNGIQELGGTWSDSSQHSGFFDAMGAYPAQFICELRAGGLDGEVLASDEQAIIAPLTTTWEE